MTARDKIINFLFAGDCVSKPKLKSEFCELLDKYIEQVWDKAYEFYAKPRKELKPLEDLWRKENSPDDFVIPDETAFFRWIVKKVLDNGIS
jgi:hypothetical protein